MRYTMNTHKLFLEQAAVFKALGHPSRLVMVDALGSSERCVCELRELVGADMSTVSKHLAVLKNAGVVRSEKRGTQVYYALAMPCVTAFLACVQRLQPPFPEGERHDSCLCKDCSIEEA